MTKNQRTSIEDLINIIKSNQNHSNYERYQGMLDGISYCLNILNQEYYTNEKGYVILKNIFKNN